MLDLPLGRVGNTNIFFIFLKDGRGDVPLVLLHRTHEPYRLIKIIHSVKWTVHTAGTALTSDWYVNSLIMVVYENFFASPVRIFCPKVDYFFSLRQPF